MSTPSRIFPLFQNFSWKINQFHYLFIETANAFQESQPSPLDFYGLLVYHSCSYFIKQLRTPPKCLNLEAFISIQEGAGNKKIRIYTPCLWVSRNMIRAIFSYFWTNLFTRYLYIEPTNQVVLLPKENWSVFPSNTWELAPKKIYN